MASSSVKCDISPNTWCRWLKFFRLSPISLSLCAQIYWIFQVFLWHVVHIHNVLIVCVRCLQPTLILITIITPLLLQYVFCLLLYTTAVFLINFLTYRKSLSFKKKKTSTKSFLEQCIYFEMFENVLVRLLFCFCSNVHVDAEKTFDRNRSKLSISCY